jgi:hypothetical protein
MQLSQFTSAFEAKRADKSNIPMIKNYITIGLRNLLRNKSFSLIQLESGNWATRLH